jgi:hypothetical protein
LSLALRFWDVEGGRERKGIGRGPREAVFLFFLWSLLYFLLWDGDRIDVHTSLHSFVQAYTCMHTTVYVMLCSLPLYFI